MQYAAFDRTELENFVEGIVARAVEKTIKQITVTPDVMNKTELANYLRVSKATIDRYMASGMPFTKIDGGSPRFYRTKCDLWMAGRGE